MNSKQRIGLDICRTAQSKLGYIIICQRVLPCLSYITYDGNVKGWKKEKGNRDKKKSFMCGQFEKHCNNCKCCPVSLLIVRSQWVSWIQILSCLKCQQFHASSQARSCLRQFSGIALWRLSLKVFVFVFVIVFFVVMSCLLIKCLKGHNSQVSRIALWTVFVFVIVFVFVFVFVIAVW